MTKDKIYRHQDTCRICGSNDLVSLYSLGCHAINNFLSEDDSRHDLVCPLDLSMCRDCTLVQLDHTVDFDLLYSNFYWYRSGVTQTMRSALRDITREVERVVKFDDDDIVLDIGSNDGTLLRTYTREGIIKVGVEPAKNLVDEGSTGVDIFINEKWSERAYRANVSNLEGLGPKVVTAIGMFYDLADPNQFIGDIAKVLRKDGIFVAQLMCLRNMIELRDIGNICHEHLEYYSLKSLGTLFLRHGLEIYDIERNSVNGESYRLWIRHIGSKIRADGYAKYRLEACHKAEEGLDDPEFHRSYFRQFEENKRRLMHFLRTVNVSGKKIWIYGASTKGNTILQYCGIDRRLIQGAVDRSPEKWGKYTVSTKIPIHSNEVGRNEKPDYFLVLPYAFIDEFKDLEKEWHDNGGRFIIPFPEFKVI